MRFVPIFLTLLFLTTGCTSAPASFVSQTEENREYQISAPWDERMYDGFYKKAQGIISEVENVKGGIVPHHLIAGHLNAAFFETIKKQNPSTIVLLGPNHFSRGGADIISTRRDWKTIYGNVETDLKLLNKLEEKGLVHFDEDTVKEEHSIYSIIPFVKKSSPKVKVLPLILRNDIEYKKLDELTQALQEILPKDAVIVSSIDFSHYQTAAVSDFHDELSINVIKTFDYDRLEKLEIDSVPSLYALLKLMESFGTQKVVYDLHTNAGKLVGKLSEDNTTSHYSAYFVKGEKETEKAISILHFGDMMFDRNVKKRIDENGADYILEKLAGEENRFFQGMDLVTANLEGPFANYRRDTTKEIAFRFDPILIPMLQKYNFSLFTLASNHANDMSSTGLKESKENLTKAGIEYYGHQFSLGEETLFFKDVAGKKLAFIGVNDTHSPLDHTQIAELIHKARETADLVIINIHWGIEYKPISYTRQQFLAHEFIDAGADVIIGHHPHVVQEIEVYKDKPIFYSLGNFVFDQYFSVPTQQGLGIGLILYPNKTSVYVLPLESNMSQVTQMEYEKAKENLAGIIDRSRLGDYNFNEFNLTINK